MLKILIADDEGFVRRGLINNIHWDDMGIGEIEQADDGLNALKIVAEFMPDIVLSDIRMPNMNGIELATNIRKILPDCKLIFMSAFSDKEYLKAAITLKAISYVEKPINLDEIKQAIKNAADLCRNEKNVKVSKNEMESKLKENLLLTQNSIVLDIINRNSNVEYLSELLKLAHMEFFLKGSYLVFVVKLKQSEIYTSQMQEIIEKINKVISKFDLYSISGYKNNDNIITVIHSKEMDEIKFSKEGMLKIGHDILSDLSDFYELFIGIGIPISGAENIHLSHKKAVDALEFLFYTGYNNCSIYEEDTSEIFAFDEKKLSEYRTFLEEEKKIEAINLVKSLTRYIKRYKKVPPNYVRDIYIKILQVVFDVSRRRGLEVSSGDNQNFFWQSLAGYNELDEVEEYVINMTEVYFEALEGNYEGSKTVKTIMKIVNTEYGNSDLSIKGISKSIFLSDAYLCVIFKKETGKTINQYITEVRIEKAKELLIGKNAKLFDIAISVGYSDHNYFTKIFKKVTSLTPSEYKERYRI